MIIRCLVDWWRAYGIDLEMCKSRETEYRVVIAILYVSDIKLIRTDTTLDLSQKAEKDIKLIRTDTTLDLSQKAEKAVFRFRSVGDGSSNLHRWPLPPSLLLSFTSFVKGKDQEAEEEIKSILQKILAETMNTIPLESVKVNEVTPDEDYWSEPEETIEVSLYEPNTIMAQNEADEAEKEIYVISERPEEPQKESKEDQPLVLVKPPTLPCIFVRPYKGVDIKERSQIFYTTDTFVLDDHDVTDSYVLDVPNELLNLKEGMSAELPKAIDAPFVVNISKGEGIT
ncbi:hypothetical protein Sjap_005328 [Stephania japonica]|uniref:Uncharacterized protein n=1 Tax=Stephania japonica TaxID=461633 RepID=A0AAP0K699_9MAGN